MRRESRYSPEVRERAVRLPTGLGWLGAGVVPYLSGMQINPIYCAAMHGRGKGRIVALDT